MPIPDPLLIAKDAPKKATRDGYGDGLLAAGRENDKVVVLDADLSGSTKTRVFAKEFPGRFFNFGVAEQNLMGHAAGLALADLIPVASSFAIFATGRAWEVVRNSIGYPGLNVKIAATHAGITLGEDGASHQIIEDIALMRVIPGMTVLVPADYWQAWHAIQAAIRHKGPVYIRLGRPGLPMIYDQKDPFEIGSATILQDGAKIAFLATGVMVIEAWKAARMLEQKKGVRPLVADFGTVKPLDTAALDSICGKCDQIVTFEEHNTMAGFGSAVAEYVSSAHPRRITRIGLDDVFGQSGTVKDLMEHYKLTAETMLPRLETLC